VSAQLRGAGAAAAGDSYYLVVPDAAHLWARSLHVFAEPGAQWLADADATADEEGAEAEAGPEADAGVGGAERARAPAQLWAGGRWLGLALLSAALAVAVAALSGEGAGSVRRLVEIVKRALSPLI
jgi:hypothetical protein